MAPGVTDGSGGMQVEFEGRSITGVGDGLTGIVGEGETLAEGCGVTEILGSGVLLASGFWLLELPPPPHPVPINFTRSSINNSFAFIVFYI